MRAHDHELVGYTVDGTNRRIVLRTHDRENPERSLEIVFSDVAAYRFTYSTLISILDNIRELPLTSALQDIAGELDAGMRAVGWPEIWDLDIERRPLKLSALEAQGTKFFEVTSSYGLEAWIVARGYEYRTPGSI